MPGKSQKPSCAALLAHAWCCVGLLYMPGRYRAQPGVLLVCVLQGLHHGTAFHDGCKPWNSKISTANVLEPENHCKLHEPP
jgi:hypothetical protein